MENTTVKKAIIMLSYDRDGDRFEDVLRSNGELITDRGVAIKIARDHIWFERPRYRSIDLVEFDGDTEEDFYAIEDEDGGYTPFYTATLPRARKNSYKLNEKRIIDRNGMPIEFNHFIAYGDGDAGFLTLYGIGKTEKEALEDSVRYGYDPENEEPRLRTMELSDRAYKFISEEGCNDVRDDRLYWDMVDSKLILAEEKA